jgi:hypothetical protein
VPPEHPIPNYVFLDMNDPTLLFDRDEGLPELPTYQKEKEEEEPEDKKTKYGRSMCAHVLRCLTHCRICARCNAERKIRLRPPTRRQSR